MIEKELLEFFKRAAEKANTLSVWENRFLANLHFTYRNSPLSAEEWISEKQEEKIREIMEKLYRD